MDKKYFKKEIDKKTIEKINKCLGCELHLTKKYNEKKKEDKEIFNFN